MAQVESGGMGPDIRSRELAPSRLLFKVPPSLASAAQDDSYLWLKGRQGTFRTSSLPPACQESEKQLWPKKFPFLRDALRKMEIQNVVSLMAWTSHGSETTAVLIWMPVEVSSRGRKLFGWPCHTEFSSNEVSGKQLCWVNDGVFCSINLCSYVMLLEILASTALLHLTLSAPQDVSNVTLSLWRKVPQDVSNVITKSKFPFFPRHFSQYFTFYLPFDLFPWF